MRPTTENLANAGEWDFEPPNRGGCLTEESIFGEETGGGDDDED